MTAILASLTGAPWLWTILSCFGLTVVSAILPWVNAEVIVVSFAALAHSPAEVALVVIVATSGQMLGKSVVFWTGRRGERWRGHEGAWSSRWRERLTARPRQTATLVLLSSTVGIPPFFLVTLAAGAYGMDFRQFFVAGTVGRLVRFGAIALLPHAIRSGLTLV